MLVLFSLVEGATHGFLHIIQTNIACLAKLFAELIGFQLPVQFRGELADHTSRATHPAARSTGSRGQALGAEYQQRYDAADQQLKTMLVAPRRRQIPALTETNNPNAKPRKVRRIIVHGLLEAADGATQIAADVAQFLGSKQQNDNAEYDK